MTAALEGGEWSASRPGRTLPPGKTRNPLYGRLCGPQGRSGRAENIAPPGLDPRTVQPVSVALPTELPGQYILYILYIYNIYFIYILKTKLNERYCKICLCMSIIIIIDPDVLIFNCHVVVQCWYSVYETFVIITIISYLPRISVPNFKML